MQRAKRRLLTAALMAAALVATACGTDAGTTTVAGPGTTAGSGTTTAGPDTTAGSGTTTAQAAGGLDPSLIEGQDVTITMWQHSYPPLNDWTESQITAFTDENPNITVEYEVVPFEEWNQRLLTALAGGQAPNVFEADDYTMAQFIRDGVISPIQPSLFGFEDVEGLKADYEGESLGSGRVGRAAIRHPLRLGGAGSGLQPRPARGARHRCRQSQHLGRSNGGRLTDQ